MRKILINIYYMSRIQIDKISGIQSDNPAGFFSDIRQIRYPAG